MPGAAVFSSHTHSSSPRAAAVAWSPQPSAEGMEQLHCNGQLRVQGYVLFWAVRQGRNSSPAKQIPLFHPQLKSEISFFLCHSLLVCIGVWILNWQNIPVVFYSLIPSV